MTNFYVNYFTVMGFFPAAARKLATRWRREQGQGCQLSERNEEKKTQGS